MGLLLGASPVSSLGKNFSSFPGCFIAPLSFPPESSFPNTRIIPPAGQACNYLHSYGNWVVPSSYSSLLCTDSYPLSPNLFLSQVYPPISSNLPSRSGLCPGLFLLILFASSPCISRGSSNPRPAWRTQWDDKTAPSAMW